jgi:hypothetical protein
MFESYIYKNNKSKEDKNDDMCLHNNNEKCDV